MGREFHGTVDHLDEMKTPAPAIKGMHHMAYRCRDAEETKKFYGDILGLKPAAALAFDKDPSGADRPYMHLFFEMGDGNYIAFFDAPSSADEDHFNRKSSWTATPKRRCRASAPSTMSSAIPSISSTQADLPAKSLFETRAMTPISTMRQRTWKSIFGNGKRRRAQSNRRVFNCLQQINPPGLLGRGARSSPHKNCL